MSSHRVEPVRRLSDAADKIGLNIRLMSEEAVVGVTGSHTNICKSSSSEMLLCGYYG